MGNHLRTAERLERLRSGSVETAAEAASTTVQAAADIAEEAPAADAVEVAVVAATDVIEVAAPVTDETPEVEDAPAAVVSEPVAVVEPIATTHVDVVEAAVPAADEPAADASAVADPAPSNDVRAAADSASAIDAAPGKRRLSGGPAVRFRLARDRISAKRSSAAVATGLGSPARPAACAPVFDKLLLRADGRIARSVVVAPAAAVAALPSAIAGLEVEAARRGLATMCATVKLKGNGCTLTADRRPDPARANGATETLSQVVTFEPGTSGGSAELEAWLKAATRTHDLVFIVAPELAIGPQAAALAQDCDGLLILAESNRTTKKELRDAVNVAQQRRCHLFGVFVNEGRDRLARWASDL